MLQSAIDDAAAAGGGTVVVPAGVHHTGSLRLRSRVELHLEAGAHLKFVADRGQYPPVWARWEGAPATIHTPCLFAHQEIDVAITGFGTIDGSGHSWWAAVRGESGELSYPRPTLIGLHECERVTIRDVRLINSPSWTVHPLLCDGVTVQNVVIVNPADSPNTDGIDPESCRNVRISDCHIDVGDDCIVIKAGTQRALPPVPCENVTITNCTMVHGHGGVVIGSEMSGGVRNVVISNCVFQGTDRGIRIKTRRGRGGVVEDVRAINIVMDDVLCPLVVNPFYFCGPEGKAEVVSHRGPVPIDDSTPVLRRIQIAHVTARRVRAAAGFLYGLPESPLTDVTIDDVAVSFAEDAEPGVPAMAAGVEPMSRAGFQLGYLHDSSVTRIRLDGVAGPAVCTEHSPTLQVADVSGTVDRDDQGRLR